MSCSESETDLVVERDLELPASPEAVWDELPGMLGDDVELVAEPGGRLRTRDADGIRIGVVREAVPGERLTFQWVPIDESRDQNGDDNGARHDAPSEVEITLEPSAVGTILRLRETRLDGAHLVRHAFSARALARA